MHFAIIAAGEGSRLQNEGIHVPKPLVKLNGEALIARLFRIFDSCDAESVTVIVNESISDIVVPVIRNIPMNCKVNIHIKSTPSSMHSLFELKNYLYGKSFCLTTVDTIFKEVEFTAFIQKAVNSCCSDGLFGVTTFEDDESPLYVQVNSTNIIQAFKDEKCENAFISGGIYYFKTTFFWDILKQSIDSGVYRMRNFQRKLIDSGSRLEAYCFSKIIDVDHQKDILTAEIFLKN